MDEERGNEKGKEVYSHDGVLLKSHHANSEEDPQCSGTLSIVEYSVGKCIEWKPTELKPTDVSFDSEMHEPDWALVNTVGAGNRSPTSSDGRKKPQVVCIELSELKSLRITRKGQQMALLQRDGTMHSSFLFQHGNADCFLNSLVAIVKLVRSSKDKHLYLVMDEQEVKSLDRSFAELNLFPENTPAVVWKLMRNLHNPYESTLEAFSKLTDIWLYKPVGQFRVEDEVSELLNRSLTESEASVAGEEYAVIRLGSEPVLPPRPPAPRGAPLSISQWARYVDESGRVVDPSAVREIIFRGGVCQSLRCEVWKFLLGYFPWDSTRAERQDLNKRRVEEYFQMKLQWRSLTAGQENRFSDFRERKSLIEKDVNRTDRTMAFYAGEDNANLQLLSDILMTYVMYNFDLGYVQGMSDLLSPILYLMTDEVDAFWCFVGFMDRVSSNFELTQAGMKDQLQDLHSLLLVTDPELADYLNRNESSNMFFCFRWLLVLFKREFSHQDIMKLWEVMWTDLPCPNFHLLVCVAILDTEKTILMENSYGFTEILKHINDLSLHVDLDETLSKAEGIYHQLIAAGNISNKVRRIIGLEPLATLEPTVSGPSMPEPSIGPVTFSPDLQEAAFERSLDLNYT